ncbi:hypothetical protein [Methanoregula sp.]|uniref:hypothetical protein n=1 Tax=Methanoregula sp. TaxID=2052170 RepID=UPI003569A96C
MERGKGRALDCPGGREGRSTWFPVFFAALAVMLMVLPAAAAEMPSWHNTTGPQPVQVGVYVVDLNTFNVADGSFGVNFYLALKSDAPVSITDLEIVNGRMTSVDTILNTSNEKSYRVFAAMTADPDLRQYPFDQHTLLIQIEPKLYDENRMILAIHNNSTGHEPDAGIQGWRLAGESSRTISRTYDAGEPPYSRAVFSYEIQRDITSTILKFFIPILLLVIVTLFSLMMKGPSRLGLNASMLIVAVFIHWRISDAIPLVAYATFLDVFMIITYSTIVLVLVSGILIQKFTESGELARVEQIRHWSILLIPPLSILMYLLLFLTLLH